jgi:oxygen-independent coproporphyrinogen-3 oxidase
MALDAGFDNTGIDLIAGLPGVSPDLWHTTLQRALALPLKHVSVYALSLEPGTPLAVQAAKGVVKPSDEQQLAALTQAEDVLGKAGFARYEISNYALPGYECRHNLGIWRGNDYIGLGPAAASRLNRKRWTNTEDLSDYMEALSKGQRPPARLETLQARDDAGERALFALRLSEGVDPEDVARRFPELRDQACAWESRLSGLSQHGITEKDGCRWRLTSRGREVCDAVLRELV